MIVSKTPFRISFFGGGTDYPEWFTRHGGAVISTAINKYCYISIRKLPPFFEHRHRVVYSKIELVDDIADIEHPVVRAVLTDTKIEDGMEIHHFGDLPARSGLGSSSSFTVGLLNAIHALQGRMVPKSTLAKEAIRVEHELLKENVGWQDQIVAAYGGLNRIEFSPDGEFTVSPVILPPHRTRELEHSIMLFFTGLSRFSSDVARATVGNLQDRKAELDALRGMVDEGTAILQDDNRTMCEFGRLMDESWQIKRRLADGVSNSRIDEIYDAAIAAGASGGKLMGAGGGGFFVFIVDPDRRQAVREKLKDLIHVSCKLDRSGAQIDVFDPENGDEGASSR